MTHWRSGPAHRAWCRERERKARARRGLGLTELVLRIKQYTKYNPESGCLEWIGSISSVGYGQIHIGERPYHVPRVVLMLASGQAPDGMEAAHSCLNRKCVTLAHLRWATPKENINDNYEAGRIRNQHGGQRLVPAQVRQWMAIGRQPMELSREIGVPYQLVWRYFNKEKKRRLNGLAAA